MNGSDANDGFTPETAKRTLADAMTNCFLVAGDTVHAAPGVYREGTMKQPNQFEAAPYVNTPCRVCVPSKITLTADGGVDETVIEGIANATASSMGASGIRCAVVVGGGRLKGFTLRGGCTSSQASVGNGNCDDVFGGGVLGQNENAVVENCTIKNCYAERGGGSCRALLVNCRIMDNYARLTSLASYRGAMVGCFVDGNWGMSQVTRYLSCAYNTTFTERNWSNQEKTTKAESYMCDQPGTVRVVNSIILGNVGNQNNISAVNSFTNLNSAAAAGLDENYRPVKGGVAIDSGSNAEVMDVLGGVDAAGSQRIYNGTVDRGCFEYDWRADYASDLGVSVPKASAGVVEEDAGQSVRIGSGGMELLFGGGDATVSTEYRVPVTVQGAGTLTVALNGDVLASLTAASGATDLVFRNKEIANRLELTYDGDDAGVLVSRTSRKRRSMRISFR